LKTIGPDSSNYRDFETLELLSMGSNALQRKRRLSFERAYQGLSIDACLASLLVFVAKIMISENPKKSKK
jgi:hypothetical protein